VTARGALNTLAQLGASNVGAFGTKEEVDPINHLIFMAAGWGGLPNKQTIADLGSVEQNDGNPHVLNARTGLLVRDCPRCEWLYSGERTGHLQP
jgi:hypothetical protein